mmetsp:Transcript_965/g.2679  ORF Transcript_965/g.2679 Transcript_965/m.2679 type:complete len:1461 (+) Transcript_965:186-4568(+)
MAATAVPMERTERDRESIQSQARDSSLPPFESHRDSSIERGTRADDLLEEEEDLGNRKDWPENTRLEQWMMHLASDCDIPGKMLRRLLYQNPGYGSFLAKDEDLGLVVRVSARRLRAMLLAMEGEVIQQDVLYQPLCELCWRTVGLVLSSVVELGDLAKRALPRDAHGQLRMLLHTNAELSRKLSESRRAYLRELSEHRDRSRRLPPEAVRAVQSLREQPVMFYEPLSFVLDETTKDFVRQTVEERLKLNLKPGAPLKAITPFEATAEMKNKQKNMLEQEIRSLKKSLANEMQARKKGDIELTQLKFSHDELRKEKEDLAAEKAEQEVQLDELDALKKQAAIDAQAARNNAAKLEEQHRAVNDVKKQLSEQKKRVEQLLASEADYKHKLRQAETEVARLNEKIREYGDLSKVRDEIVEVNKKLQRAEKEIQKRTSMEGDLRKSVHDLRTENRSQKEEIDAWAERYEKDTHVANEALASAKRSLSIAQEEHRQSFARAQAEVAHLQLLLERSEERLDAQQASKDNLLAAASTFRFEEKTQVLDAKALAQDASTKYRELERVHGELGTNFKILTADHNALNEAHSELDGQHTELSKKHKDLAQRFADLWEEKKKLEKKLASMLEKIQLEGRAAETDLQHMHKPRQVPQRREKDAQRRRESLHESEDLTAQKSVERHESVRQKARLSALEVLKHTHHSKAENEQALLEAMRVFYEQNNIPLPSGTVEEDGSENVIATAKQQVQNLALLAGLPKDKISGMLEMMDALDMNDPSALQETMATLLQDFTGSFTEADRASGSSSKGPNKHSSRQSEGDRQSEGQASWTHWHAEGQYRESQSGATAPYATGSDFTSGVERRNLTPGSSQSDMSSTSQMFREFKEGLEETATTSAGDTRPSEAHTQQNSTWLPDAMPSSSSSRKNAKRGSRTRFGKRPSEAAVPAFGDGRGKGSKAGSQPSMSSSAPNIRGPHSSLGSERGSSSGGSSPDLPALPNSAAPPPHRGGLVHSSTAQAILSTSRTQFHQEGADSSMHSHTSRPPAGQTLAPLNSSSKAPQDVDGVSPASNKPAKGLKKQATTAMHGRASSQSSQSRHPSRTLTQASVSPGKKRPGLADLDASAARGSVGSKASSGKADDEPPSRSGSSASAREDEFDARGSRGLPNVAERSSNKRDSELLEFPQRAHSSGNRGQNMFDQIRSDLGLQDGGSKASTPAQIGRGGVEGGDASAGGSQTGRASTKEAKIQRQRSRKGTTLPPHQERPRNFWDADLPPRVINTLLEFLEPRELQTLATSSMPPELPESMVEGVLHDADPESKRASRNLVAQDADSMALAQLQQEHAQLQQEHGELSSRLQTPDLDSLGVLAEVVMRNTVSFWSHEAERTKAIQKQAIQALKQDRSPKIATASDVLAHIKQDLDRDLPSRSASGGRGADDELLEFPRRSNPERDEGTIWDQVRSDLGLEEQQQPPEA